MAIYDLFSKRAKAERGELPDVYQYNNFDNNLKIKVIHIIKERFIGNEHLSGSYYKKIIDILCKEYGLFELTYNYNSNFEHLFNYFLSEDNIEKSLDIVELCFIGITTVLESDTRFNKYAAIVSSDDSINELNERFKEEGFGYKFESGKIIKISSEFIHNEVVKPVLSLLSNKEFKGAEEEFLSAHTHYRKSENKECIVDCLKAFESTIKIICKKRKYSIKENLTAKELINQLFEEKYIPQYLQSEFNSLQSLLESGVPTIRNKTSAHGQGNNIINPDNNLTEYTIHLTASNILFLIKLL